MKSPPGAKKAFSLFPPPHPPARAGCQSCAKIYRVGGEIVRTGQHSRDVPEESCFAVRHGGVRYLIPFMDGKKAFETYAIATHFVDGQVFEEYMAEGGQIACERYGDPDAPEVEYHYVSCVPGGTRPALEESHGFLNKKTPEAKSDHSCGWYQDLKMNELFINAY